MKSYSVYQCEYCLSVYKTSKEAYECEADCLKLTLEEYMEYLELLSEEKKWFSISANMQNDEVRAKCDMVIKEIIEFQEKHGITDSRW